MSDQPSPPVVTTTSDDSKPQALLSLIPKLVAATPFALATLALLYDVGWFSRIGFDFFSLFSLTEHLVFGMEGIPYLLASLMLIFFIMAGSILAARRLSMESRDQAANGVRIGSVVFFFVAGIVSGVMYPDAWPTAVMLLFVGLMYWFRNLTEGPGRIAILLVGGLTTILIAAFAQGYVIGAVVLNPKTGGPFWPRAPLSTISLVDGPSISGRVLRSGERGVLVLNDVERTILFKRWEEVRGIDLSRP